MENITRHQILDQLPEKVMSSIPSQPYLRVAGDGTYELLVPLGRGFHILPYCFHSKQDATIWLATRKGRERIHQVRQKIRNRSASAVIPLELAA
jgi:hypothetical protein